MKRRLDITLLVLAVMLVAMFPHVLLAQTPGWTWTQQTPAGPIPSPRFSHAMAYDSYRGKTILFGGYNGTTVYGDTWEWDGNAWSPLTAAGQSPSPRNVHAMVFDTLRGKVVLFGGENPSGFLNDTWEWNGIAWTQVALTGNLPRPSGYHAMAFDSQRGKTVLFGGYNFTNGFFNDTWEWDGTSWIQVALSGPAPSARYVHAMAYDIRRGKTVMFGGYTNSGFSNDTWEWDGSAWAQVAIAGTIPGGRVAFAMTYDSHRGVVVVFGGAVFAGPNYGDTWEWNGLSWTPISPPGTVPSPRKYHAAAFDSTRGTTVLFGGSDNVNNLADTWELVGPPTGPSAQVSYATISTSTAPTAVTGHAVASIPNGGNILFGGTTSTLPQPFTYVLLNDTWTKQFSVLNPMPRADASLLLDPARQNNVLFGGRNPLGTALNETWTRANGQWNYLPLAIAPTPRSGHRMVFDATANVGLLFGGKDAQGNARNDFWQWNGTAWSQLTPTTLPPARSHHGFAYDQRRQRAVVYGGIDGTTRIDDVWEWNGATWTQITPLPSQGFPWTPGARSGHGMAYDPRSERIVVHGGETIGCQQDAWSWDGTQWMLHIATSGQPSARTGAALWHDPSTNQLLVFGGGCGTSYTNDLWSLSMPVFSRWSNYGQACVGSLGTPTIAVVAPSAPVLGTSVALRLGNIFGTFVPAFAAVGFSRTTWNGIPLPVDLTPVSLPGCFLQNSMEQVLTLTAPISGIVNWSLALPNNPQLLGVEVFVQGLGLEVPGYPRFASMTDGLLMRLGDR